VKSAYHLAGKKLIDTSYLRVNGDWAVVWNLEVLPVVKNFMRRMLHDFLPARSKLITIKVQCSQYCVL
jgi:hypothetical protein